MRKNLPYILQKWQPTLDAGREKWPDPMDRSPEFEMAVRLHALDLELKEQFRLDGYKWDGRDSRESRSLKCRAIVDGLSG